MAISEVIPSLEAAFAGFPHGLVTILSALLGIAAAYLYLRPALVQPKGAPPLIKEDWPIIGTLRFFIARWDFFREGIAHSVSGQFSFHVGSKHVIGLSGDEARKAFFESKELSFNAGYASLFAGAPPAREDTTEDGSTPSSDDPGWFLRRVLALLKGDVLRRGMPTLISDTRKSLDAVAADPSGLTDPFESIYRVVYQLTMRTVACHEIAEDPALLAKTLHLYEEVERAATPAVVMYPWLPTPAKFRRMWGGAQLYMIFKKIVADRLRTNARSEDALQICMDSGDDIKTIITFVLGALFAGQLNSGINAAWVLVYLSQNPYWQAEARAEVEAVCDRYVPDKSLSLKDRLSQLPADAWETDFKILELCLRDSIRIQTAGAAFRRNTSGHAITIKAKGEDASSAITIPEGSCVMYHMADVHLDETVYPDPLRWDPGRYLPDRAEDRKKPLGYIGWGAARHPCPGQRFAKLESNIITAFFLAYFDFEYSDKEGRTGEGVKPTSFNVNAHSAHKPSVPCFLKYRTREEAVAASA